MGGSVKGGSTVIRTGLQYHEMNYAVQCSYAGEPPQWRIQLGAQGA